MLLLRSSRQSVKPGLISVFLLCLQLLYCTNHQIEEQQRSQVNFAHLEHLTQTVHLNGQLCDIIHIYSEYPDYQWADAAREGIACVDDVARAAVVYLRYFELTGIDSVLPRAQRLLNFVLHMQAEDGEFYNFIDSTLQINTTYRTSEKSFNFWAARGYWALGMGYRIFKTRDQDYAARLKTAFLRCKMPIQKNLAFYNQYADIDGRRYPLWLVNRYGSDATAALLLGINEFLRAETENFFKSSKGSVDQVNTFEGCEPSKGFSEDTELATYAKQLADGIMAMQLEEGHAYPGAFLSWPNIWHAWGNAQTQALASLGKTLRDDQLIQAAKREADLYFARLLNDGWLHEWELGKEDQAKRFPQIAYGVRCMALGLLRLFEATGDTTYARQALQAASWLLGNNAAKTPMYDPQTGRCFDGIEDSTKVNLNSGAESTIEGLLTVMEISMQPNFNFMLE